MGKIGNTEYPSGSDIVCLEGTEETVFVIQGGGRTSLNVNGCGWSADICFTLNATDIHGIAYGIRSNDIRCQRKWWGGTAPTITGDHQNRVTDYTAIVLEIHEADNTDREEIF